MVSKKTLQIGGNTTLFGTKPYDMRYRSYSSKLKVADDFIEDALIAEDTEYGMLLHVEYEKGVKGLRVGHWFNSVD